MKYLGIDYGQKRIGVAISDEDGKIAFPKETIENIDEEESISKLQKLAEREKIEKIVVGLPVSFSGEKNPQSEKVQIFAEKLFEIAKFPVEFENEILTTKLAAKGSTKKNIDASSAALILQSYLDKISH